MEVIAVICVVGPMVVHVGHPSHMRQRQFPRVLNLEHLEDGAEVSIRHMSWSNYLSLLRSSFQRVFWEVSWLGCCKWRAMWWTWWEVLVNRNVPKSILWIHIFTYIHIYCEFTYSWINWSPAPPCLLAAVEGVDDAPPVPGPHHLHHGLPPLLVLHVVGRVHTHHQPLSSLLCVYTELFSH